MPNRGFKAYLPGDLWESLQNPSVNDDVTDLTVYLGKGEMYLTGDFTDNTGNFVDNMDDFKDKTGNFGQSLYDASVIKDEG